VGDGVGAPGVPAGKPPTTQQCNIQPCPRFYWKLSPWSECSTPCATGVQTTTATCTDSETGTSVSESLCLDPKPQTSLPCNQNYPCPVYEWRAGNWSECKSFCGPSTQNRTVHCYNVNPGVGMVSEQQWRMITVFLDRMERLKGGRMWTFSCLLAHHSLFFPQFPSVYCFPLCAFPLLSIRQP